MRSLPSVHDLFEESVSEKNGVGYVVYTDKDVIFEDKEKAYVFQQEGYNEYDILDINKILEL